MRLRKALPAFLALALLALASGPSQSVLAEVLGVYFAPRQDIDKPLIAHLDGARRSIKVAMYALTLDAYAEALIRAHHRGVKVEVILDARQARHPASDASRLEAAGVPVRYGAGSGLMHHKFSVVDGLIVTTGSFNATWSASHRNAENAVVLSDPEVVALFEEEFRSLWESSRRRHSKEGRGR